MSDEQSRFTEDVPAYPAPGRPEQPDHRMRSDYDMQLVALCAGLTVLTMLGTVLLFLFGRAITG